MTTRAQKRRGESPPAPPAASTLEAENAQLRQMNAALAALANAAADECFALGARIKAALRTAAGAQ